MEPQLIERIETKKIEKYRKLMTICSIILLILLPLKLLTENNNQSFRSLGYWLDTGFVFLALPIYTLITFRKKTSNRTGQFIEWWSDKVIYKLSGEDEGCIYYNEVKSVKVGLDNIDIQTQELQCLNIADFTDYDMRLKIKNNFENLVQKNSTVNKHS